MALNPRTPVIVGQAQLEQRERDPANAREPLQLMGEAVEAAGDDAGNRDLLRRASSVRVVRGMWRYGDPGRAVAERIGVPQAQTVGTPYGGNMVQSTVIRSALDLLAGAHDVVVITGAECGNTQRLARSRGVKPAWSDAPGEPDLWLGEDKPMNGEAELARKIQQPIQVYPIFENALRAQRGESIPDHLVRISELWARFNDVAVKNPHAWIREPLSAEAIRTPGPGNRMISFPYPKLLNSNNSVDQGAALLMCTVQAARAAGIPEHRWVYPHVGTEAHDHYMVSNRADLHSSPAIRLAGRRALELAGLGVDDLAHVDLYSCFPSAVQVAANELGLSHERPLTVTGGLTFGGGPLNNYVMHSIARMVEVLRDDPGAKGLVTANGGFLTKHAFCVYSTEPPARDFQHADLQDQVDATPQRDALVDFDGPVTIESYTVMYGPDGPQVGHAACLAADGQRTWANTQDPVIAQAMTRDEFCGRAARIDGQGTLQLAG